MGCAGVQANWQDETFAWFNREPGSDNSSLSFEPWCALGGTPGIRRRPFDNSELSVEAAKAQQQIVARRAGSRAAGSHPRNDEDDPDARAVDRSLLE